MPSGRTRARRAVLGAVALVAAALLPIVAGCRSRDRLTAPARLHAPYATSRLWAVAPFANESGASLVDGASVADAFMAQAQHVVGVDVVPVNRVLFVMQELGLPDVRSDADARAVMNALGVDGLVVGTVTAWDPYPPMTLGLATQLYARDAPQGAPLDLRELTRAPSDLGAPVDLAPYGPVAQAAEVFDAANHMTLARLRAYATGRDGVGSAYGEDIYLVSMELYTKFASYGLLQELLLQERRRVSPGAMHAAAP